MVSHPPDQAWADPGCWPAVQILGLRDAIAALTGAGRAGVPVLLVSLPHGSAQGGALWFHRMTAQALAEVAVTIPDAVGLPVLDCADRAGDAQEAIALGLPAIRYQGSPQSTARIRALAALHSVRMIDGWAEPLSLRHRRDGAWTCENWLKGERVQGADTPQPDTPFL